MTAVASLCASTLISAEPPPVVPFTARSTVQSIAAGDSFDLVCTLQVPVGWHVYWEDPGSSGMATSLSVRAPEGFAVSTPRLPRPTTHPESTGPVNALFGEVPIAVRITPPHDVTLGADAAFELTAHWLVCREQCHLGEATATVRVPITAAPGPPTPAAAVAAALPPSIHARPDTTLTLSPHDVQIEGPLGACRPPAFLPVSQPTVALGSPALTMTQDRFCLTIPVAYDLASGPPQPERLRGLLMFGTQGADPAWIIDVPLAHARARPAPEGETP